LLKKPIEKVGGCLVFRVFAQVLTNNTLKVRALFWFLLIWYASIMPAYSHISLVSPVPIMDGYTFNGAALKAPPFGAPGVDIELVAPAVVTSGARIAIDVDVYVNHPGEIVVLYTSDVSGKEVFPVLRIPASEGPVLDNIPHENLLFRAPTPKVKGERLKVSVQLPPLKGEIILVVRQVMLDKVVVDADKGEVDLSQVYYHQAAKLYLVD